MDRLQSSSTTLQMQVGSRQRPNSYDFISQMSDDVLVMILTYMPIKDAVATSGLATRWRFLWRNLRQLNFDGSEMFINKMDVASVVELEREKYINQVNSVIRSYNHQTIKDFRIHYGLKCSDEQVIDNWLQFAVERKVEFLELDLTDNCISGKNYDFRSRLMCTRRIPRCLPMVVVALECLKKLILKRVNVTKEIIQEFLKNSPHLEMISIHDTQLWGHIKVGGGGKSRNLKHFELVTMSYVGSMYLSDLDLVSFTYKGSEIHLRLGHLPKLAELVLDMTWLDIKHLFAQISSCALTLKSLSMGTCDHKKCKILNVPKLPNLKNLRLTIGGRKNDFLLYLASIMNACPNLETFSIKPLWTSPILSRKKARDATNPHQHLQLVEIMEYGGRKCDFELVAYIIHTAVALNRIVVAIPNYTKNQEAARSSAERIKSIKPQGVELVIL